MKAAPKTPKAKRQEEQANFISWRFALLCGCILLALGFLLGRVAWLQVISPDMLVRQGDMRSLRVQEVSTARGMITDRSGRPLAVSVPVKAIWADPKSCMKRAASPGQPLEGAGRCAEYAAGSAGIAHQYQPTDAFHLPGASGEPRYGRLHP